MSVLTLPRTQAARAIVLDQVLHTAVERGLPIPSVQFLDFTRGFRVELDLPAGDRAGVDRWARHLGLDPGQILPADALYVTERHTPGCDLWCGACWVLITCDLHPAGT